MERELAVAVFLKLLTTIPGSPLLCLACARGRLAGAAGPILLTGRCGAASGLLFVVKLILRDHVHLLDFQAT